MAIHLNYAQVGGIGLSKAFDETDERTYFDGTFTSDTLDTEERIVHASNFPDIVTQITTGVRILDSHKHQTNGIGKTVAAQVNQSQVDGSFYILKGAKIDGKWEDMRLDDQSYPTTKQWIIGMKDGMIDKMSMGWYAERNVCNICQGTIYRASCYHYPGETYNITNKETGEESIIKATFTCYGITVVEMSLVYFGANPDARLIAKAKALAANNRLDADQIDRIESKLQTAIVSNERSYFMPYSEEQKAEIAAIVKEAIAEASPPETAAPGAAQILNITDPLSLIHI